MINYYKTLGITKDASETEIREAYRKLTKKYHPDVNPNDPTAAEKFKAIHEAYEILCDKNKRTEYNSKLKEEADSQTGNTTTQSKTTAKAKAQNSNEKNNTATDSKKQHSSTRSNMNQCTQSRKTKEKDFLGQIVLILVGSGAFTTFMFGEMLGLVVLNVGIFLAFIWLINAMRGK